MSETKPNILVIDDSALSRKKICVTLQANFNMIQAENGQHGLELISKCRPHFIFCDLLMPEMNGFDFLKQLNAQYPHIPCTVVTADIQQQTYDQCYELGAFVILKKPAKKEDLFAAIELMKHGQ